MDDEIPPLISDEAERYDPQECIQREKAPSILPPVNPYNVPPLLMNSAPLQRLIHERTPQQESVLLDVVKEEDITSHTSLSVAMTTTSGVSDPTEITSDTPAQVKEELPQETLGRVDQQCETGMESVNAGELVSQVPAPSTEGDGSAGQTPAGTSPSEVKVEAMSGVQVKVQEFVRSDDEEEEDVVIWILTDSDDDKPTAGTTTAVNKAAPSASGVSACEVAPDVARCRLRPRPPRDYRTITAGMGKTVDIEMLYASTVRTLAPSLTPFIPPALPPAKPTVRKSTPRTPRTPRAPPSRVAVRRIICSSDSSPTDSSSSSSCSSLFSSPCSSPYVKTLTSPSSLSSSSFSSSSSSDSSSSSSTSSSPSTSPTSTPLATPSTTPVRPRRPRLSRPSTLSLTPLAAASPTASAPDTPASPWTLSPAHVPFKRRADHWSNFVTPDNPEGYKPEQLARLARMTPEEQHAEKLRIRQARRYKERCMTDDAKRQREITKRRRYNDRNREKQREYARDYNDKHREQQMHHMREHRKRLEVKQMKKEYNRAYNARRRAAAAAAAAAAEAPAGAADIKSE